MEIVFVKSSSQYDRNSVTQAIISMLIVYLTCKLDCKLIQNASVNIYI